MQTLYGVVKIRTICKDNASGVKGMITHVVIGMDRSVKYIFSPEGLTEAGEPLKPKYLEANRLDTKEFENLEVPLEILGSQVTDDASGFTGMATDLWMHPNGCFHIMIQPSGKAKDGELIKSHDFDIRQCSGVMIQKIPEPVKEASRKDRPSPAAIPERPYP